MENKRKVTEIYPFITLLVIIICMVTALIWNTVFVKQIPISYYLYLKIPVCICSFILIFYSIKIKKYHYSILFILMVILAFPFMDFGFYMINDIVFVEIVFLLFLLYLCYKLYPRTDHDKHINEFRKKLDKR
ncbi:MAG TPA: hypothetical protein QF753_04590 [Victivallales bacterium]|nr:hypothetical protein [Victivallales bacterium]